MSIDTSKVMIFLLEECNLNCEHCVRDEEPMNPGYILSLDQFKRSMAECVSIGTIRSIHFSGGEPTLWNDKTNDLVDLLIQISNMGFDPGFTSNGSYFESNNFCDQFFKRYFSHSKRLLHVCLSIDSFHNNFDREEGRSKELDNVLSYRGRNDHKSANKLLIKVITVISKEEKSLLPEQMILHYQSKGVEFNFIPLESKGRARSLSASCPDLDSRDPADLGTFSRFHEPEYHGKQANDQHVILIDNQYYLYTNDFRIAFPQRWEILCSLGRLQNAIINRVKNSGYTCHRINK